MGDIKREFKYFTIPQYRQEEDYLSDMHSKGWKLKKVTFPCIYTFEKCMQEHVRYRLDYNREGAQHKAEYVQMFADCGWDYLFDFVGYSYFRKTSDGTDTNDEIFCDDESRLDMMKRVFKGRVIPLIILFFSVILPQFLMNVVGYSGGGHIQNGIAAAYLGLGFLYLLLFGVFSIQFYQYEKSVRPEEKRLKWKYLGLMGGLGLCAVLMVSVLLFNFTSDYSVHEKENGFIVEANRLNKSIIKTYNLKKGDNIHVTHDAADGELYIRIGKENEQPVFYGNTFAEFDDFTVEVQEDGCYELECSGKRAEGTVEFAVIQK